MNHTIILILTFLLVACSSSSPPPAHGTSFQESEAIALVKAMPETQSLIREISKLSNGTVPVHVWGDGEEESAYIVALFEEQELNYHRLATFRVDKASLSIKAWSWQ